ncbi:MAG: DUF4163 domain-containing protein [Clostridiales bacterium]|nr:DUF4163 domain-containing protein [Clostridiales bacterium]
MKRFRTIRRILCLTAAMLLAFVSACCAEGAEVVEEGFAFSEELSVRYPQITGLGDEALQAQVNRLIQEKSNSGGYLSRAALLISGGSLKVEWKGGILGDVFSCAVSASGAVENTRNTYVWTAVTADLRDGQEIAFDQLFTDAEAAKDLIAEYLEDEVAPELSAHLANSELTPVPELFFLEKSGVTLLYPVSRLSTLSDRAGDIRIGWNVLRDVLDLSEDSVASRIGVQEMISLTGGSAEQLRAMAAEGSLTGIPARLGDSMKELTDRYHMLIDPDGFEGGRLFSLEGGCFGDVFLMTDDLTRGWENSVVEGIRMDRGCLWGLCVRETAREDWIAALGEPDGSAEIDEDKAEAIRGYTGTCDYYYCGERILQLYSDEAGILVSIVLT